MLKIDKFISTQLEVYLDESKLLESETNRSELIDDKLHNLTTLSRVAFVDDRLIFPSWMSVQKSPTPYISNLPVEKLDFQILDEQFKNLNEWLKQSHEITKQLLKSNEDFQDIDMLGLGKTTINLWAESTSPRRIYNTIITVKNDKYTWDGWIYIYKPDEKIKYNWEQTPYDKLRVDNYTNHTQLTSIESKFQQVVESHISE